MIYGRKYVLAWILMTLCITSNSHSTEHPEHIRIAAIIDVPITAATAHLMQHAYQRLGVNMKTLDTPSRRALMMADKGLLDGDLFRIAQVAFDYPNLIRVDYPLLYGELRAVVRPGDADVLNRASAKPKTAVVRLGVIIAEKTAKAMGLKPIRANSYEQARTLLESGRVDMALVSDIEGFGPLALESWQAFEVLPKPVATFKLYHYLNQSHAQLAQALPEILKDIETNGTRTKIFSNYRNKQEKWYDDEYSAETTNAHSAPNNSQSLRNHLLYFL